MNALLTILWNYGILLFAVAYGFYQQIISHEYGQAGCMYCLAILYSRWVIDAEASKKVAPDATVAELAQWQDKALKAESARIGWRSEAENARIERDELRHERDKLKAAMTASIPKRHACSIPEYSDGFNMCRAHVIDEFRAAGLEVDP